MTAPAAPPSAASPGAPDTVSDAVTTAAPSNPAWLRTRARAYALALGAPASVADALADTAMATLAAGADPTELPARVRAAWLAAGTATDTAQRPPAPDADTSPGADPATWIAALARAQGLDTKPARAALAQTAPIARTPLAARPFRRTPLRRALSRALWRPLAALLRPVQLLAGRVAP